MNKNDWGNLFEMSELVSELMWDIAFIDSIGSKEFKKYSEDINEKLRDIRDEIDEELAKIDGKKE